MKHFVLLLALITVITMLTSCNEKETIINDSEMLQETEVNDIRTVEDMNSIEGVTSVECISSYCTPSESVYKVNFESDGLKRYFEIALPNDYTEHDYPCILYFPDVGYEPDFLIDNFARNDIIVLRLFCRGDRDNEGVKDYCGNDYTDAVRLIEICKSCGFLCKKGIFTAGATMGSSYALRLASDYPDDVLGCTVVDPLFDYESVMNTNGDNVKSLFMYLFGCSEDKLSAECESRSPKSFCHNIKANTLIFCYDESQFVPSAQSEELNACLKQNGCETELVHLKPLHSDFNGTAFLKLIPWISGVVKK